MVERIIVLSYSNVNALLYPFFRIILTEGFNEGITDIFPTDPAV